MCFSVTSIFAQSPVKVGKLQSAILNEISGITPSYSNSNSFWVHNDSGGQSSIYLIDYKAQLKTTVDLEDIRLVDTEDIAMLKLNGSAHILLADIGNNLKDRDTLSLFLFKEPTLDRGQSRYEVPKDQITEIKFRYKDKLRDAEALFIDPKDNTVYIISKRDFKSTVFKLSLKDVRKEIVHELDPLIELPFTFTTGADIRHDGRYIIVKNLTSVFLWKRIDGQDVVSALQSPYRRIPYEIEPQGEAICFGRDNTFFYTISERPFGLDAYLYKYEY